MRLTCWPTPANSIRNQSSGLGSIEMDRSKCAFLDTDIEVLLRPLCDEWQVLRRQHVHVARPVVPFDQHGSGSEVRDLGVQFGVLSRSPSLIVSDSKKARLQSA